MPYHRPVYIGATVGVVATAIGTADYSRLFWWAGLMISIVTGSIGIVLTSLHQARQEKALDTDRLRQEWLDRLAAFGRLQMEMEERIGRLSVSVTDLEAHLERVHCRYPRPDGTAYCQTPDPDDSGPPQYSRETGL